MNESAVSLRGVFPPIPTPFDAGGEVAYQALSDNLARWNEYGLTGYVVLGSNGEGVFLSDDEKLRVLETCRKAIAPGKLMIAGTGCEPTRQTIALTRNAAAVGADAALVVTPHYYKGKMTADALVSHFQAVADASPVPIILYNVPSNTGVDMDAATIARIAQHPNVIGVKDTAGNITKLGDTVRLTDRSFQVLAGSAGFFFPGLAVGAVGGVLALANIAPQQALDIYRLTQTGRWDEAADLHRRMIPVNAAVTVRFGIAGLKAALDLLGYYGGPVRLPLLSLADSERQVLQSILHNGEILPAS
jgi:4-hydroxy-2-oxoglutarate aldolase